MAFVVMQFGKADYRLTSHAAIPCDSGTSYCSTGGTSKVNCVNGVEYFTSCKLASHIDDGGKCVMGSGVPYCCGSSTDACGDASNGRGCCPGLKCNYHQDNLITWFQCDANGTNPTPKPTAVPGSYNCASKSYNIGCSTGTCPPNKSCKKNDTLRSCGCR